MEKLRLSYSKVSTFYTCRVMYRWIYEERLVLKKKPIPLQVGDVVHRLFDLYFEGKVTPDLIENLDRFVKELYPDQDETTFQVALQAATLFSGYLNYYKDDPLTITSPEVHLECELDDFTVYGRVDALGHLKDNVLRRIERKTTSAMDSLFLEGLRKSLQAGIYDYLLERSGIQSKGTIYDLLVKTKIPQYKRNPVLKNRKIMDMAVETFRGVARSIKRGDFYPAPVHVFYNRTCDYWPLCCYDSKETRESFYTKIENPLDSMKGGDINENKHS